jgi:hypothetical protein
MSKAREHYYFYRGSGLADWIENYVSELEQQNEKFIEDLTVVYLEKNKLEHQKSELISTLSIALDPKRKKLYFKELSETLKKYSPS